MFKPLEFKLSINDCNNYDNYVHRMRRKKTLHLVLENSIHYRTQLMTMLQNIIMTFCVDLSARQAHEQLMCE